MRKRALSLFALGALAACDISAPIPLRLDAGPSCALLTPTGRGSFWVDNDCLQGHSELSLLQSGCDLTLTPEVGPLPRLNGRLDGTLEGPDLLGCLVEPAVPGAVLTLRCLKGGRSCSLDLMPKEAADLGLGVERLPLHEPPLPFIAPGTEVALGTLDHIKGYVAGMALVNGGVVLGSRQDAFFYGLCTATTTPSRFLFVKVDDGPLTVTRTATGPPCLQRLSADPSGGFLATFGDRDHIELGRYDAAGRRLSSLRLSSEPETVSSAMLAVGDTVYVTRENTDSFVFAGAILAVDLPGLRSVRVVSELGPPGSILHRPRALLPYDDLLLLSDDNTESVSFLRRSDLSLLESTLLNTPPASSGAAGYLTRDPARGLLYVSAPGGIGGEIWVLTASVARRGQVLSHRTYYPTESHPWASLLDGDRLLVGLTEGTAETNRPAAWIVAFDRRTARFGRERQVIGLGIVSELLRVDAHHALALLPFEDVLVRITIP